MGDLFRFPLGGGANVLRVDRFRTSTGLPHDVLSLDHRHGSAVVWKTGDDGTIDDAISVWRACGARLFGSCMEARG